MNVSSTQRHPQWILATSNVFIALLQSRRALRTAASKAGDRSLAQRLRRLARRRGAAAEDLIRLAPPTAKEALTADPDTVPFAAEIESATEIGAIAACLRANRRLRAAIETALDAAPPASVSKRLDAMRSQADRDAGMFNAQLRDLIVVTVPVGGAASATPGVAARN